MITLMRAVSVLGLALKTDMENWYHKYCKLKNIYVVVCIQHFTEFCLRMECSKLVFNYWLWVDQDCFSLKRD